MKIKVLIEEVVSNAFEADVDNIDSAYEEIRNMYRNGEIVVENPSLIQVNVMIYDENGKETDWVDLHV